MKFGFYNEDLVQSYTEGQKVSFSCNKNAIRTPSDGIIECGPNGWNIKHKCVPSKMIATTLISVEYNQKHFTIDVNTTF